MEQSEKLEALHRQAILNLEEYLKEKGYPRPEGSHDALHSAKADWQNAWLKLKEALMVLEKIEI